MVKDETFDHLFTCQLGVVISNILRGVTFNSFSSLDLEVIESLGKLLQKYQQYREILMCTARDIKCYLFYILNLATFSLSFFLLHVLQHTLIS